ncbi:Endoglucanase-like protein [Hapsidospora chrysogenum ATCC 11550]|uniref:Endoglucanase-like protein n=1 Tax=Hapsidospora chrysogenum (strain ATCC 11550 / CBS 779.69 / DSM 880 / IAM 14645 / JCM 23072 / IMI 49137) TaxID=857340 RepID=A0A086T480_HAPC1|nr:Endoglucanase-like protein [Hapsidospora chrysogenum ATCC 11550]
MTLLGQFLAVASLVLPVMAADKPSVPLSSSSRWIVDTNGERVKLRCINWPGHMESNIPEGLSKQSLDYIADWIADEGFTCVRLTFSIDMALNQDVSVKESFQIGASEGGVDEAAVMEQYELAVEKNAFLGNATRIDVFGAVEEALWERGVMTVLDNHVSKAKWCCNLDDGNGWWRDAPGYIPANSEFFDTQEWLDGLEAMAEWSVGRPGVVGVSLRNELRAHVTQILWGGDQWFEKMPQAARIVHNANPDVLISIGGLDGGNNLAPLRDERMPIEDWEGKNVWDAHAYSFTVNTPNFGNCDIEKAQYGFLFGFVLGDDAEQQGPLWLSEFGVGMDEGDNDGLSDEGYEFLTCLVGYLEGNDADWALWSIAGSYYIREGTVDREDNYGALTKDWSGWRNEKFKGMLGKMWEVTQGPK